MDDICVDWCEALDVGIALHGETHVRSSRLMRIRAILFLQHEHVRGRVALLAAHAEQQRRGRGKLMHAEVLESAP